MATVFYGCLADLLATHWGQEYSQTINWLRCRLSFALPRYAIMCILGSMQVFHTLSCAWATRLVSGVLAESRLTN